MQPCPVVYATPNDAAYFFGYHDLCPWNYDDDTLAVLRVDPRLQHVPNGTNVAEICLWRPQSGRIDRVAETLAWNWQQGTRLQWLPGSEQLLYNTLKSRQLRAAILDLSSGKSRDLPFSVSSVDANGRFGLSPHFGRLSRYWPAYGFAGAEAPGIDKMAPSEDGLWQIDIVTGHVSLLLSLAEIVEHDKISTPGGIPHFVAHPTFNPSGTRFVFMHRFLTPDGAIYSRLMLANRSGSTLRVLAEEKVSHFDWYDDDTLLVWSRLVRGPLAQVRSRGLLANPIMMHFVRLARKLSPNIKQSFLKEYYYLINVNDPSVMRPVGEGILEQDGHPMFSKDRRWLLTDTYPDKQGYQTLILFDMVTKHRLDICRFHSATAAGDSDLKCDLHPRWNRDNSCICVDSTVNGVRQCLIISATPELA